MVQHADIDHTGIPGTGSGAGTMAEISDTLLASPGTFDLTSIPGTYTHLRLVCLLRSVRASNNNDNISMRFNGDTAANYDSQSQQGTNASASQTEAIAATSLTQLGSVPAATSTADNVAIATIDIPFYAGTTFDKMLYSAVSSSLAESTGLMRVFHGAGHWRSTAAITRIEILTSNAQNYVTGSRVILYGVS